jgi:hypothetical protein
LVAATGHALIAIGGGWGTLSEIALGLRLGRPVVLLNGWGELFSVDDIRDGDAEPAGMIMAESPESAVEAAIAAIDRAPTES